MKRALICGISGQDGALLSKKLLELNYDVMGTSRDAEVNHFDNLSSLGIKRFITLRSMSPTDFRSVYRVVGDYLPDEVYNLSGQSSVGLSFDQPVETLESVALATLNLLEAIRSSRHCVRFYNAASGECFGDVSAENPATEQSPFRPRSPYGIAKAAAFWTVANYREAYQLYACSGLLFNHESALRPDRFVTKKIIRAAARISAGSDERLRLGNLNIIRDWGWAEDYVDAMWRMLQLDAPTDFVIATGKSHTLTEFVDAVFGHFSLKWQDHVDIDPTLFRASEIQSSFADPSLAQRVLGWNASVDFATLVKRLILSNDLQEHTQSINTHRL